MNIDLIDLEIWGKSRGLAYEGEPPVAYPLICHLLDAAALAGGIWDHYLSSRIRRWLSAQMQLPMEECRAFVMLVASLHDIGKACPGFQNQPGGPPAPRGYPDPQDDSIYDHASAGRLWLGAALAAKFGWIDDVAIAVAEIVGGHHGTFHFIDDREYRPEKVKKKGLGRGQWGEQRTAIAAVVQQLLKAEKQPTDFPPEAQIIVCAIVVLADWLASRSEYIRSRLSDVPTVGDVESLGRFLAGSAAAARGELVRAGLVRLRLKESTFRSEFGFTPNRLQSSLESNLPEALTGPGLLIVTEQTGRGKTEAALYASRILGETSGTAGLALLLPTMATSNAMEPRLGEYLERQATAETPLNLIHSMAWLRRLRTELESTGDEVSEDGRLLTVVTEWLSGGKKAAFAPVCVGTVDQALLSVLPVKHNAFRMLAFANKTIVIDEVHAYDAFVRGLLRGFLSWCGYLGVPVVLMSATLPKAIAHELATAYLGREPGTDFTLAYPGWAFLERDVHKPVIHSIDVDEEDQQHLQIDVCECEVTDEALNRMPVLREELAPLCADHGCAAVVCTTVKEAQQTFVELTSWLNASELDVEVVLLHSNMPLWQREAITDDVVARFGKGKGSDRSGRTIIVSTQVLEQSVDIDMDLIISDLAPFELLLQRAGRGHRHPKENDSGRPRWASGPRLVVLSPEGAADPVLPKRWAYVYPPASLIRTQRLLLRETGAGIRVPADVQDLVDILYTDDSLIAGHEDAQRESLAGEYVQRAEAKRWKVPEPEEFTVVSEFSGQGQLIEEQVSTRFDADTVKVLPLFSKNNELFLDPAGRNPLPQRVNKGVRAKWSVEDIAAIIEHTVPVRRRLLQLGSGVMAVEPLPEWLGHYQLKHLVPLIHETDDVGNAMLAKAGQRKFYLDPVLGLKASEVP